MKTKQRLNRKNILRSSLLLLSIIFICRINSVNAQPVITSINPSSGSAGTPVILTGTNFNTTASNNIVYFGATKAIVVSATATLLNVTVPLGATYQPVSVTNAANGLTGYSTQFFMPTFACGEALASSSFATPVSFVTENNPYNLNSGDLDGDGKIDLAVANYGSNSISLYKNISSGGLLALDIPTNMTTENGPTCIAVGDLNGDGKPDLAVINYNSNILSVYKNNSTTGVISFENKIDYPTGNAPLNVIITDIDGDGKPDLAATNSNSSSNTISVYKNTSTINSISFEPKIDFATGNCPFGIAAGDINSDGKTDIAVANYLANTISVFSNTSTIGNISFAPKVDFASGPYPLDLAIGDMNGDSKFDITITNYVNNYISVYKNNGSGGSISFAPYTTYETGSGPWGLAIGDLNGDAKPDMASPCLWTPCVSVFGNNSSAGNLSFQTGINLTAGTTSREISIADFNADGKPDMATVNYGDNAMWIYQNTNGGFVPAAAGTITGTEIVCQGQNAVSYTVPEISNVNSYQWTLPTGATGSSTTNTISVNYGTNAISGNITVAGVNSCGNGISSSLAITVNPFPDAAGAIVGSSTVCQGQNAVSYTVPEITNANSYQWTLPTGATGSSSTNTISVNYGTTAISGNITVAGVNTCGNGVSSSFNVTVNQKPITPVITNIGNNILQSNSLQGNQWYNQLGIIQGAVSQNYAVTENGNYYVVVTIAECMSEPSNIIQIINTDIAPKTEEKINLYPNPFSDKIRIETEGMSNKLEFEVYNSIGQIVIRDNFFSKTIIETNTLLPGVYIVKIKTDKLVKFIKVIKK